MSFNTDDHISHKGLAEHLGISPRRLGGEISKFETPLKSCGDTNIAGERITYYDRTEALEWACLWSQYDAIERGARGGPTKEERPKYRGQIVPPRTPTPFKPIKLDLKMRIAYDRAEAQPPMITPNGHGDYSRSWGGKEVWL